MNIINKRIAFLALTTVLFSCKNKDILYDATGVFEATEVIVSAEANGKITELKIEEGQSVKKDQVLGHIDSTQLSLRKEQILRSSQAVNSRHVDVSKQIASIQQQIVTQKREKARFENLVRANAGNQKQVDDINSQILYLEKQLVALSDQLNTSNRGISEEASVYNVQAKQVDDQILKSKITSPINGVILSKYSEVGELANTGKVLFKIADVDNMILRAYVTASQLTEIKLGQKVKVYSDYGEKGTREYSGKITWISNKAEFTPKTIQTRDERANLVYAVKIAVKNDGYIKQGMYGEVKF